MNAATMVDLRAAEQDWTCSLLYCVCVCVCVVCASGRACLALQAASECRQKLQREKLEDLEEALRLYLVRKGRGSCCILGRLRACDRRPLLSS